MEVVGTDVIDASKPTISTVVLLIVTLGNTNRDSGIFQNFIADRTFTAPAHGIGQINVGLITPISDNIRTHGSIGKIGLNGPQQYMAGTGIHLYHPLILSLERVSHISHALLCRPGQNHVRSIATVHIQAQNGHSGAGHLSRTAAQLTIGIVTKSPNLLGIGTIIVQSQHHGKARRIGISTVRTTGCNRHSALEVFTLTAHRAVRSQSPEISGTANHIIGTPLDLHGDRDMILISNIIGLLTNTKLTFFIPAPGHHRTVGTQGNGMTVGGINSHNMAQIVCRIVGSIGAYGSTVHHPNRCGPVQRAVAAHVAAVTQLAPVIITPSIDVTVLIQCQTEVISGSDGHNIVEISGFCLCFGLCANTDLLGSSGIVGVPNTQLAHIVLAPGIHIAILTQRQSKVPACSNGGNIMQIGIRPYNTMTSGSQSATIPGKYTISLLAANSADKVIDLLLTHQNLLQIGTISIAAVTQLVIIILAPGPNGTVGPQKNRVSVTRLHLRHRNGGSIFILYMDDQQVGISDPTAYRITAVPMVGVSIVETNRSSAKPVILLSREGVGITCILHRQQALIQDLYFPSTSRMESICHLGICVLCCPEVKANILLTEELIHIHRNRLTARDGSIGEGSRLGRHIINIVAVPGGIIDEDILFTHACAHGIGAIGIGSVAQTAIIVITRGINIAVDTDDHRMAITSGRHKGGLNIVIILWIRIGSRRLVAEQGQSRRISNGSVTQAKLPAAVQTPSVSLIGLLDAGHILPHLSKTEVATSGDGSNVPDTIDRNGIPAKTASASVAQLTIGVQSPGINPIPICRLIRCVAAGQRHGVSRARRYGDDARQAGLSIFHNLFRGQFSVIIAHIAAAQAQPSIAADAPGVNTTVGTDDQTMMVTGGNVNDIAHVSATAGTAETDRENLHGVTRIIAHLAQIITAPSIYAAGVGQRHGPSLTCRHHNDIGQLSTSIIQRTDQCRRRGVDLAVNTQLAIVIETPSIDLALCRNSQAMVSARSNIFDYFPIRNLNLNHIIPVSGVTIVFPVIAGNIVVSTGITQLTVGIVAPSPNGTIALQR